uniref:Glucosidase 2 subunit beta n=1 Tax=Xenopsylla cheopis TaxID=163159 RepID=A0A6M2DYH4_XENCH
MNFVLVFLFLIILEVCNCAKPSRPRGVPLFRAPLYANDKSFTCLDGLAVIPFTQVNDDYCDCEDGSDEPGTSACPNGIFYCNNAGYKATVIPSSRVNDGICDCCDTSDEYNSTASCMDTCHILGREALLEAEKKAELSRRGNQLRNELIQKGKLFKSKQQEKLLSLEKSVIEVNQLKEERLILKTDAESLENIALQQYQDIQQQNQETREKETDHINMEYEPYYVFDLIDTNKNQLVEIVELQAHLSLDKDNDGIVSLEEAKFFLNEKDEMDLDTFLQEAWPRIKPFHMKSIGLFKPPDDNENIDIEGDNANDDEEKFDKNDDESAKDNEEQTRPAYDEETQRLVDLATEARNNYNHVEQEIQSLEHEISNLKEILNKDFGPDEEFAVLNQECFEFEDREYIYKICLFDRVTQKSRSSGSETRLGMWSHWSGPIQNKYSAMTYTQGAACWNGPQRSTNVDIVCGLETKLVSVSEPNRCEYKFIMETPAVCSFSEQTENEHDEL